MPKRPAEFKICILAFLATALVCASVRAQEACSTGINLLPKYGEAPKCQLLREADDRFLAAMDRQYGGDRRAASRAASARGWTYLSESNLDDAMRRFNQAWLLDKNNGVALWGIGAVLSNRQEHREAVALFDEAAGAVGTDLRFRIDHARTLGIAGTELKDARLIELALLRFASIHRDHPDSTINLQNWAITLHFLGRYEEAWEKIERARAAPDAAVLSPLFVEDLRVKARKPK